MQMKPSRKGEYQERGKRYVRRDRRDGGQLERRDVASIPLTRIVADIRSRFGRHLLYISTGYKHQTSAYFSGSRCKVKQT